METKHFLDQLQTQITQLLESPPAKDLEKNFRALLTQGLAKLDLVTREEFEAKAQQLTQAQLRLDALEKRLQALETRKAPKTE